MEKSNSTARQKALAINLDATTYGTFAEIGGGQEVARWFFRVGGAAGTIAKTISAYDMSVSDSLYGPAKHYVSRERLEAMLRLEFAQLLERLGPSRGDTKRFFAFANTVATSRHGESGKGRGWLGVRFQSHPREEPSSIIIHAHLLDSTAEYQEDALGVLGVNLIHGAFLRRASIADLIDSIMDELSRERIEVDMIKLTGPTFARVDNRLVSLQLVERGLTDAAMFTADGEVVQPSEVLYKKPILVERGSFRPATRLTLDLLTRALDQFLLEPSVAGQKPIVLAEMTLRSLSASQGLGHEDFLARAEILGTLGFDVLISRFGPYYQLAEYLAGYTDGLIGLAVGLPAVRQVVADERYFTDLPGGVLESAGRLFKRSVKMYVYPTRDPASNQIHTVLQGPISPPWNHLRDLLLEIGRLVPIHVYDESLLSIHTPEVLERIQRQDPTWEAMVPAAVAQAIKTKNLFGWKSTS
jgi:hypothetical protein